MKTCKLMALGFLAATFLTACVSHTHERVVEKEAAPSTTTVIK